MDALDKLVEAVGVYEILNNVIPRAVYVVLVERITSIKVSIGQTVPDLILYYFIGLVVGRSGSIVIKRPSNYVGKDYTGERNRFWHISVLLKEKLPRTGLTTETKKKYKDKMIIDMLCLSRQNPKIIKFRDFP